MSLLTNVTRQHRSHSNLLLPLLHFLTFPSSSSLPSHFSCSSPVFFFSAAFRRTISVPFHNYFRFSTSQPFSPQKQDYPFELIHSHHSLNPRLLDSLKRAAHFSADSEAMACIDASGVEATKNLVCSLIWELRKDWRLAFLGFKWGQKWGCIDEKSYELIVWVLCNHKKFNNAWIVICDMHRSSTNIRRAMLFMIDRFAAANYPGKAIEAFNIMEKFRLTPDEEAFYSLLNALCKHGYIEEAEEFMLVNKKLFPLKTEGFNVILNGWCNLCVDLLEAKRVWREMCQSCVTPNAASYTFMISCFSKVGNLFDSLRLYDEMKKRGWIPGVEVYNSLIYVLTCENCFNEALKFVDQMKKAGLWPDSATYNSMIHPLCKQRKLVEVKNVLDAMSQENIRPTMETYHALLEVEDTCFEATLDVFNQMRMAGLAPGEDTFLSVLFKFFRLEQAENALKIWAEMKQYAVTPNLKLYKVLVEGLVRCGLLTEAREYFGSMIANGFSDDPKLRKILKEPRGEQNYKEKHYRRQDKGDGNVNQKNGSRMRRKSRKSSHTHVEKL